MIILEKIARGIIVHDHKILLCKNLAEGHYFLPGGHVEDGESPEETLRRELDEEIGQSPVKVKQLIETKYSFIQNGKEHNEIASIYLVLLADYENIKCKETHINFEWIKISDFAKINFKPQQTVNDIIKSIQENGDFYLLQ